METAKLQTKEGQSLFLYEPTDFKAENPILPKINDGDETDPNDPAYNPKSKVPTVNKDDFDPEIQEPEKPSIPEPISRDVFEKSAKSAIMAVDIIGRVTLPWGYKISIFKQGEVKRAQEIEAELLAAEKGGEEKSYTPSELRLHAKWQEYKKLEKSIPFTDDEIKLLQEPLADVFQKYGISFGPEYALATAVMAVLGPRLVPFLSAI